MLNATVSSSKPKNAPGKVRDGVRQAMRDAADTGFSVAWDEAPSGATNTLKHSGVQPTWQGENTLVWGFTAPYADDVEFGTDPHIADLDALRVWARRVLGSEAAAGAVWRKIAAEGTPAQRFAKEGVEEQRRVLEQEGIADKVDDEFE